MRKNFLPLIFISKYFPSVKKKQHKKRENTHLYKNKVWKWKQNMTVKAIHVKEKLTNENAISP